MRDFIINLQQNIPVIIGELGGFVSAEGLACKNDGIHFNSESYREFGNRYFNIYLRRVRNEEE